MMGLLRDLLTKTLLQPAEAMEMILALKLDRRQVAHVFALGVLVAIIATFAWNMIYPTEIIPGVRLLDVASPIGVLLPLVIVIVLMAALLTQTGRMLGGQGDFVTTLAFLSWFQIFQGIVRTGGLILSGLSFEIASIVLLVLGVYEVWILLQFQKVTHSFETTWSALGSLAMSFIASVLVFSLLIAPFVAIPA